MTMDEDEEISNKKDEDKPSPFITCDNIQPEGEYVLNDKSESLYSELKIECDKIQDQPINTQTKNKSKKQKKTYYQCAECDYHAPNKATLLTHIKSVHDGDIYLCNLCPKKFTNESYLSNHKKLIHEGIRYHCDQCKQHFTQKQKLEAHIKLIHEGLGLTCKHCGKKFSDHANLSKHRKSVHEGQRYQCDQCGKEFTQEATLKRHKLSVHDGIKHKCDHCGQQFTTKSNLTKHKRIHMITCELCDEEFTTQSNLTRHKKLHHKDIICLNRNKVEDLSLDEIEKQVKDEVVDKKEDFGFKVEIDDEGVVNEAHVTEDEVKEELVELVKVEFKDELDQ